MLYLSTRNRADSFTAHKVIHEACAPDGGLFVPFHLVSYSSSELDCLMRSSFTENLSHILNYFFASHLSKWQIECYIGKNPVSFVSLGQKIIVAELWHNPEQNYRFLETSLISNLAGTDEVKGTWVKIAIQIAVLFGLYAQASQEGITLSDLAIRADDFISPLACSYAQLMGLPIQHVLYCFQENSDAWNFIHHGEVSLSQPNVPNLERFIYSVLGKNEVSRYLSAVQRRGLYRLNNEQLAAVSKNIFPAVVGKSRTDSLVAQVRNSNSYELDECASVGYGGLQDFRSKMGESRLTMLFSCEKAKE